MFLLSLIPLQPARFSSTAGSRGNTFVAKIRPAFRPLSKDRMINHSRSVSLAAGTRAYVTADGNSSTSKIPIKARPVINLLGLCRSTALLLEHLACSLEMLLTTVCYDSPRTNDGSQYDCLYVYEDHRRKITRFSDFNISL